MARWRLSRRGPSCGRSTRDCLLPPLPCLALLCLSFPPVRPRAFTTVVVQRGVRWWKAKHARRRRRRRRLGPSPPPRLITGSIHTCLADRQPKRLWGSGRGLPLGLVGKRAEALRGDRGVGEISARADASLSNPSSRRRRCVGGDSGVEEGGGGPGQLRRRQPERSSSLPKGIS